MLNNNTLQIKIVSNDQSVIDYYTKAAEKTQTNNGTSDSGFDLIAETDIILDDPNKCHTFILPLGIECAPLFSGGYNLIPRSSIFKTRFRMANSIGLIDNGYRGKIGAPIDYNPNINSTKIDEPWYMTMFSWFNIWSMIKWCTNNDLNINTVKNNASLHVIKKGTRLFQLVHPSTVAMKIEIVNSLNDTERGVGGFGSTN